MALGAVITEGSLAKKRKGSNSEPTVMMSQLPLLLTDRIIFCIILIAERHSMLGVSCLSVRKMGFAKMVSGTGPPKELGGHCGMGA